MSQRLKTLVRSIGLTLIRWLGSDIVDERTGQKVGRLLLVPWRGKILVLGEGGAVIPRFNPQTRLSYWKREIQFTSHPPVDYPHEPGA